jgi:hypothetical protein
MLSEGLSGPHIFATMKLGLVALFLGWRFLPALRFRAFTFLVFARFSLYPISQIVTIALRPSDQLLSTSLALIPQTRHLRQFPDSSSL